MKAEAVKNALISSIQDLSQYKWLFSNAPEKDFTRNRKLPFKKMISAVLAFRGGTLNHEMSDFFGLDPSIATSSAFIQQRSKILPEAFECLFHYFTDRIDENKLYHGLRLLAVDGSDLQIAANPNDPDSYFPGANGQKPYNLLHINAMYDLLQCTYLDAIIQKRRNTDEPGALTDMTDRSDIEKALLLADRGYESYNILAHIQEKGWCFLIRIKDNTTGITSGLDLPDKEEYDIPFYMNLTRKQSNSVKQLLKDKNRYKFLPTHVLTFCPRYPECMILPCSMAYPFELSIFPFPIPCAKLSLQIWMRSNSLCTKSRKSMPCAGELKLPSAI